MLLMLLPAALKKTACQRHIDNAFLQICWSSSRTERCNFVAARIFSCVAMLRCPDIESHPQQYLITRFARFACFACFDNAVAPREDLEMLSVKTALLICERLALPSGALDDILPPWECEHCGRTDEIYSEGVQCDECDKWWYASCTSIDICRSLLNAHGAAPDAEISHVSGRVIPVVRQLAECKVQSSLRVLLSP